ncbi:MAG: methylated-DNA--[protein]-cysteine S-methyltransferase [Syntrophobacteraceae bacterium]
MKTNKKTSLSYIAFETPLGWILVAESRDGIALVDFLAPDRPLRDAAISAVRKVYPDAAPAPGTDSDLLEKTKGYILDYLTNRVPPPKIPIDLSKGTPFDHKVWRSIETIAFGESKSYGQIAVETQSPGASRAVGRACGRNPVPILIPCHRVIASGGKLGGFSCGLEIKRALLDLEKP